MRVERMLAAVAAEGSPDLAALNATGNARPTTDANADHTSLDIPSAVELDERVAESVSQELDYWEKLVFSFDMDRDPGGPSQSDTNPNTRGGPRRRGRTPQTPGVPSMSSGQSSSSGSAGHTQPSDSRHLPNPPFPHGFPSLPGQPPNPQFLPPNQLGGLDPYTLAQLAALSALQQQQQPSGTQAQNPADPAAVLRQLQALLYPSGGVHQGSSGSGGPPPNFTQGFPQLQPQASSSRFPSSSTRTGNRQSAQSPLPESSGQQWPLQVPFASQFPFLIDPSLVAQLPHLSPLLQPGNFAQPTQTPGAGPSTAGSRARSRSTTSAGSASTPVSPTDPRTRSFIDETAIAEDKRRRNTAASARFRIKKKHRILALERSVVELEARADDLEREASELRRENGWLKEMLIMKGRSVRAQAVAVAAELEQAEEEDEDEESEEAPEDEGDEDMHVDDEKETEDRKGKGKEKAT